MTEEDEEFNRIEREAAMRKEAVAATIAKREWVGLTLEDKQEFLAQDFGGSRTDAMDWAERKLKEKNT